jgi:hypothetical protein
MLMRKTNVEVGHFFHKKYLLYIQDNACDLKTFKKFTKAYKLQGETDSDKNIGLKRDFNNLLIELKEKSPVVFDPDNIIRIIWDFVITIAVTMLSLLIPFNLTFSYFISYQ